MDGTAVESAFALLLTKVTKPSYPAINIFCAIIGRDTNLCALSGTSFREKGEAYDDETNNVWYGWAGSLAHNRRAFKAENVNPDRKSTRLNSSHPLSSRMPSSA